MVPGSPGEGVGDALPDAPARRPALVIAEWTSAQAYAVWPCGAWESDSELLRLVVLRWEPGLPGEQGLELLLSLAGREGLNCPSQATPHHGGTSSLVE